MSRDGSVTETDPALDALLAYVKATRGFDFSGYKRSSLERRIAKRMEAVGIADVGDYMDHLEVDSDEFAQLFDTILINVTAFFRDAPAWAYLADEIVPSLLSRIGDDDPVRIWCAACASGEEAYTLAMVFAQALGDEAFLHRVKIYATEVDEEALDQARQGTYGIKQVEGLTPELREQFFERTDSRYTFRKDLRRTVIFGRNDLTQDAPISRIDLLTCRNALMYFNVETQERIVNRLHFALNPRGFLFLGKSEMLIAHTDLFQPVNLRRRVFAKVVDPRPRERLVPLGGDGIGEVEREPVAELRDGAFEAGPGAQLVVDGDGVLAAVNARARALLGLATTDAGRPLRDLEVSYRPVELRSVLDTAYAESRTVSVTGARMAVDGEQRVIDVHVMPVRSDGQVLGATIVYDDVTAQRRVEEELEASKLELGTAYAELQSTVEELETTNEELQSTNEELETTNEELQSANEELETMNEELQSTNEELETINEELRRRSIELNEANEFLERVLGSMELAVIVVDAEQTVQTWNAGSAELWGVRSEEARGQHLWGLDIGLPMDGVRTGLRAVLSGRRERADIELDATNRRGRAVRLRVTCLPLGAVDGSAGGAIVLAEVAGAADGDATAS